ncbi:MAG TPA: lamin tail domain-containing protein [Candidatus Paceibacterota bacterium]|nr:lamin tail domain-containing protein [Candidatus Paceibacterota bacterium]HMP19125.1 lamin tail domain-containing protein [Candidatus Paceibacterota bacterium]HMP85617.1 lamin tail domain-containing protein [Candidatus Paceibacterota bacterium]
MSKIKNKGFWFYLLIFLSILFFSNSTILAQNVFANVLITEIMYDPEGTDTGREWIEVFNNSEESIDLTTYKLFENNVNHKITEFSGGKLISSKSFAIIADNPPKFLIDHPNLTNSLIFDSAFSLNNTGEEIAIIDASGNQTDRLSYSSDLGAKGDGNSLQIYQGVLISAKPTPNQPNTNSPIATNDNTSGDGNSNSSENNNQNSSGQNSSNQNNSTHSGQNNLSKFVPKINFEIDIGRERYVLINTPVEFELFHNQENSSGIKVLWSFGDGNSSVGKKTEHYFDREGEYNVIANAGYDKTYAIDRTKVYVFEPKIEFSFIKSGKTVDLMLKNNTNQEINIGEFFIKTNGANFVFPKDTILSKNRVLYLSQKTTKLEYRDFIDLYYPSGDFVSGKIFLNI